LLPYSSNRRQGLQPLTGFTPQQAGRSFTIHHSPLTIDHSPFTLLLPYASNRRQGLQPLTGFTPQQAGRSFTIHHSPLTIDHSPFTIPPSEQFFPQSVLPLSPNNHMSAIIRVSHLSKQFKDTKAVDDLSFTVNEGDVYGFLGQNGAGKSTTIRMLLSLIAPSGGEIVIFEKKLATHRSQILRQVGAVIEKPDLYKYLSAYDNLSIFAKMSDIKVTRELLMRQLEMVGLADRAKGKVETFSQGMKQRLGIAVALVHNPALIILDEPTNGLDPQGIADIRNLILRLSREMGKTVLISSHLLSEIELIANRMIILHKGKKMVEGTVAELLDPAHSLIQLETTNDAAAKEKLSQSNWADALQQGNSIRLLMNKQAVPQLINDLVGLEVSVLSVNSSHSLENYFLSLTTLSGHVEPFAN
jgi:ABC-type multidrug transport system ATPase subunit